MNAPIVAGTVPYAAGYTKHMRSVVVDAIERALFELHTGLPARVQSYDPATQSAVVQPLIQRVYLDPDGVARIYTLPPISNVPVLFLAGGGWVLHMPLAEGDLAYLTFAERSLDTWLDTDGQTPVDPLIARKHDLSDAVLHPGLRPRRAPIANLSPSNMVLGREDGSTVLEMTPSGTVNIKAAQVVNLGGTGGAAVGRVGDAVTIDAPAFLAWVQAIAAATGLRVPIPFTGTITGHITAGASKVTAT